MSSKKYFVALATPSIELPVIVTDPNNVKTTIQVGYKRYNSSETKQRREAFGEFFKEVNDLLERKADKFEKYTVVNGVKVGSGEIIEKGEDISDAIISAAQEAAQAKTIKFTRESITYIKGTKFEVANGEPALSIPDTRTFADTALLTAEGYDNALDFVLDIYLDWDNWANALLKGAFTAINNAPKEDPKAKN